MTRTAFQTLSWFCLVLQLTGAAATFGRVLCVAADGHVELELAHAGSCETETRRHHPRDDAGKPDECSDHPCTDVAVSYPALQGQTRTSDDGVAPRLAVAFLPQVAVEAALAVSKQPNPVATSPCGDDLRARRSIVLLV